MIILLLLALSATLAAPVALWKISGDVPSPGTIKSFGVLGLDIVLIGLLNKKLLENKKALMFLLLGALFFHTPIILWLINGEIYPSKWPSILGLIAIGISIYLYKQPAEKPKN